MARKRTREERDRTEAVEAFLRWQTEKRPKITAASLEPITTKPFRLLALPKEMRDLIFQHLCHQHGLRLRRFDRVTYAESTLLLRPRGILAASRQLRSEFLEQFERSRASLPILLLLPASTTMDYSVIDTAALPESTTIVLEFPGQQNLMVMSTAFAQIRVTNPVLHQRHITLVFTSNNGIGQAKTPPDLFAQTLNRVPALLTVVVRQELVDAEWSRVGIAAFYEVGMDSKVRHVLRSDDRMGFIGVLRDWEKKSAAMGIWRDLKMGRGHLSGVVEKEWELLRQAIAMDEERGLGLVN